MASSAARVPCHSITGSLLALMELATSRPTEKLSTQAVIAAVILQIHWKRSQPGTEFGTPCWHFLLTFLLCVPTSSTALFYLTTSWEVAVQLLGEHSCYFLNEEPQYFLVRQFAIQALHFFSVDKTHCSALLFYCYWKLLQFCCNLAQCISGRNQSASFFLVIKYRCSYRGRYTTLLPYIVYKC